MSSKGQVIIPKSIREAKGWGQGDILVAEDRPEGVMLRRASPFPRTIISQVLGAANYEGPRLSDDDIDQALEKDVAERWGRSVT